MCCVVKNASRDLEELQVNDAIIDRLPSVEEVERALVENRQNASLLRSVRAALQRRNLQQTVSAEICRILKTSDERGAA